MQFFFWSTTIYNRANLKDKYLSSELEKLEKLKHNVDKS